MKKEDVDYEESIGFKIIPGGYSHCSSIGFEKSYFSYRCSIDREMRHGIINPIKRLVNPDNLPWALAKQGFHKVFKKVL